MFGSKTLSFMMIGVGFVLIMFGIYVPDSFLPPAANLSIGLFTVIHNSVRLGMLLAADEAEEN